MTIETTTYSQKISLRECFQAPPGYLWSSIDYSAQELRVAAALSKDPVMRDIYILAYEYMTGTKKKPVSPEGREYSDPKIDIHLVAATFLNEEVKRIVKEEPWNADKDKNPLVKKFRKAGKTLNFGLIYLATAASFTESLNCTVEEAQELINAYFGYPDGFYGLGWWLKSVAILGATQRWIKTPLGNHIFINQANAKGLDDRNTVQRKAANHHIQGPSAEMTKLACIYMDKEFDKLNYKYRNLLNGRQGIIGPPVHDEINPLVPGDCNIIRRLKFIEKKGITQVYYDAKFDLNNDEHVMALEYQDKAVSAMEEAMKYIFDKVGSDIPAVAEASLHKYWNH